ncbi:MAG: hypothetical protein WD795_09495 [Woeseia sp.]
MQSSIATPVQPVRTVPETPAEPAGPFVEAAEQDEQIVAFGVDAGGELDDGAVELVDGGMAVGIGKGVDGHRGTSVWLEIEPVILYR